MIILDPKIYAESIQNIGAKNPLLRTWLRLAPPPSFGKMDNPKIRLKKKSFPVLQKNQSLEFKNLDPVIKNAQSQTLILFGSAYGMYYKKLKSWLAQKKERRLLIFEDRLDQLQSLLATPEGYELSSDEKVDLFYLKLPHFWEQNFFSLRQRLSSAMSILAIESYRINRSSYFASFKEKLLQINLNQNALLGEYLNVSAQFYENTLNNFNFLNSAKLFPSMFNEFKNVPAIICGAGPSMSKSAQALKKLLSKALIFAGGNALSVLNHAQVEPHLTVGIDPNPPHEQTFSKNNFFHLPFIYRSRVHHGVLKKAHGELLYTPQAVGYPYIKWLEKQIGIESKLIEEGMNVINFSLMLALKLGCNPIILVGCDLAYQGNDAYDKACSSSHPLPEKGTIDPKDFSIHRGYFKKSNSNKKVYTLWKWVEEAKWISRLAQKNSNTVWLNATQAGLKIPHLTPLSLEEIEKNYLSKEYDFPSLLHQSIQLADSINIDDEKKGTLFQETEESLLRCQNLLFDILMDKDPYDLVMSFLEQEMAYKEMLSSISDLYKRVELEPVDQIKRKQKRAAFLLSMTQNYLDVFKSFRNPKDF